MSMQLFYGIKAQQACSDTEIKKIDASTGYKITIPASTEFIVVEDVFISLAGTVKWKDDFKDLYLPLNSPLIVHQDGTLRRVAFIGRWWEISETDELIIDYTWLHRIEEILASPELSKIGIACGQVPALYVINK